MCLCCGIMICSKLWNQTQCCKHGPSFGHPGPHHAHKTQGVTVSLLDYCKNVPVALLLPELWVGMGWAADSSRLTPLDKRLWA